MAKKESTIFLCTECGYETNKWYGCCPSCGTWNSLCEYTPPKEEKIAGVAAKEFKNAVALSEVGIEETVRIKTCISEFDRVLGGGIVPAMAVLIGGDPGIGKSTLLMKAASILTESHRVLYVTGEESASQLKLRAKRLGANENMLVLAENSIDKILSECERIQPQMLIIDSIQTMLAPQCSGASGSMSQIRECTALLLQYSKNANITLFIVGHVTKDGAIAGPKMLEHMVDTVLYFEGDRHDAFRLLRTVKNRFGSTNEIGVFEMTDTGIEPVTDTASMFLSERGEAGCAVTAALEGTRIMPVEVQALLSLCPFNNPRRMSAGFDSYRLQLLLAVLSQKANLKLYDKDVYINVVGGMRIDDRANDLAVCLAIASAYYNKVMDKKTVSIGEVGLTGELRSVSRIDARLNECIRLGFDRILLPKSAAARLCDVPNGVDLVYCETVRQAISAL